MTTKSDQAKSTTPTAGRKPEPQSAGSFEGELKDRNRNAEAMRLTGRSLGRMGTRYRACSLSNYQTSGVDQAGVLTQLKSYADELPAQVGLGTNIMLHGPPGTGKDHLLAAMVREAGGDKIGVEWTDGADLYGAMRDRISSDDDESEFLRRFTAPQVLAISDPLPPMGAVTDFQRILLFRVIDRRYRDVRPTWMTLNVKDRREAESRLSPNIIDRLGEGALVLSCNWPSWRSKH